MDFLKKMKEKFLDDDKDKEVPQGYATGDHGQAQSYYNNQSGYEDPPPPRPQLPPGWIQQWDQSSQRWYYLKHATGRTQWKPPSFSHAAPPGSPNDYGQGHNQGYMSQYGSEEHNRGTFGRGGQQDQYGGEQKGKDKSLKYGLGGAAVGVLAGGVIAHEMTEESDNEGHRVTQSTMYTAPAASEPYATMPPPAPRENEDGESISSSDKEEIEDKREELEEAQEYNETVEEGYDS